MSVFQVREWWSSKIDAADAREREEFDTGSMCVGNFDNDPSGSLKIATGSLNGVLRIYAPKSEGFKLDDLCIEEKFDKPILQLEAGRFVSTSSERIALAILHPHEICVYLIIPVIENSTNPNPADKDKEDGTSTSCRRYVSHFKLEKSYSHLLGDKGQHFTAANFTYGPFGGVLGRDYIAVQSMDGQLQVCEQEGYSFVRQLNHILLPGPICYVRKMDSIIVVNSQLQVDCYRYHSLASGVVRTKQGIADELDKTDLMQTDWTVTIGEQILQIFPCRFSRGLNSSQVDIFLLGEHSFLCLSEQGNIRTQHKFNQGFEPICCVPYGGDRTRADMGDDFQNVIVSSINGQMLVFQDKTIIWSAINKDLSGVPVAQKVCGFGEIEGYVVTLDEFGKCQVTFMGTETPATALGDQGSFAGKDMDYEAMVGEHRKLLEKIRNSQDIPQASNKQQPLSIRVVVPKNLDEISFEDNALALSESHRFAFAGQDDKRQVVQLTIRVYFDFIESRTHNVHDIQVSLELPPCVESDRSVFLITPEMEFIDISLRILPDHELIPNSLETNLVVSYIGSTDASHSLCKTIKLPFSTFCEMIAPSKACKHKITVDTDKDPVRLPLLFADLLDQPYVSTDFSNSIRGSTSNAVSFKFFSSGDQITILASKNTGRYRIQSPRFEALYLATAELNHRLKNYFEVKNDTVTIQYKEALPLKDLFSSIEKHFRCRLNKLEIESELNDRSHQYRIVQKRLLSRFKDKAAKPLSGLNVLLQGTHSQVIELAQRMEQAQKALKSSQINLATAIKFIWLLSELHFNISKHDMQILVAHFSDSIKELDSSGISTEGSVGWEEYTQAAVTELLKTHMSRSEEESRSYRKHSSLPNQNLKPAADTTKLRKRITILFDRLAKGVKPSNIDENKIESKT